MPGQQMLTSHVRLLLRSAGKSHAVTEKTLRIVAPSANGESWCIRAADGSRASLVCSDRIEAISAAKRIVRNAGGGQVHLVDRVGQLTEVYPIKRRSGSTI